MEPSSCETGHQTQVDSQLQRLEAAHKELSEQVGMIQSRLESVLREPIPPPETNAKEAEQLVGLANRLDVLRSRFEEEGERLARTLDRLEL